MVMMVVLLAPALTILYGCAPALVIEASPPERTSEATGLTQVLRAIGMSIGTQVIAFSLASSFVTDASGTRFPGPQAYLTAFWVLAGLSLVMVICSLAIPARRKPAADEAQAPVSKKAA
jgi:MFS family permease